MKQVGKTLVEVFAAEAAAKAAEPELMQKIADVYGNLSPENLTCDGECSAAEVRIRRSRFNRELKDLFKRLGRKVSESEAYNYVDAVQHVMES